jgi:3-phenylpropionate/trans-cinnamate dioxygenase ferredoxin component
VAAVAETILVCRTGDVEPDSARRFDVDGLRLAVVRIGDEFYVIGDRCSHEDYSLAEGEIWAEDHEIECPRHGSTFDLRTGDPCSLPATKPIPVYEVVVEDDEVKVVRP